MLTEPGFVLLLTLSWFVLFLVIDSLLLPVLRRLWVSEEILKYIYFGHTALIAIMGCVWPIRGRFREAVVVGIIMLVFGWYVYVEKFWALLPVPNVPIEYDGEAAYYWPFTFLVVFMLCRSMASIFRKRMTER